MTPLQRELTMLQKKLCPGIPVAVEIRRDFVLTDALKEAGKKKFDVNKRIKVNRCTCTCVKYFNTNVTMYHNIISFVVSL